MTAIATCPVRRPTAAGSTVDVARRRRTLRWSAAWWRNAWGSKRTTTGRIGFITIHLPTGAGDVARRFSASRRGFAGGRRLHPAGRVPTPRPGTCRSGRTAAVEVVSPTDNAYELQDKLDDYRSVGIPLVWVVWRHVRLVQLRVDAAGRPIVELRPGETLTGGDVLPGFAVAVAELFRPAPTAAMA